MSDELKTEAFNSSLITHHSSLLFGLDAIPLTEPKTGVGHYTFELARALARVAPAAQFELDYPSTYPPLSIQQSDEEESRVTGTLGSDESGATGSDEPDSIAEAAARARDEDENETRLSVGAGASDEVRLASNLRAVRVGVGSLGRHWWSVGLPRYIRRRGLALFHGTNYDVPLWRRCPTVLTIHDLSQLLHPSTHEARRVRRARRRLPLMARQATLIITPTESVRREVCEHLGVTRERVVAVPEAPRRVFRPLAPQEKAGVTEDVRRRLGLGEEFLLAVGTIEPRKNLLTLVRAFAKLSHLNPAYARLRLVVVGGSGWLNEEFFAYVASSDVRERVRLTGYVSDEELRVLYSACALFVYPSLYEGFGLPPLEAMACGAPVVASRIPTLVETAGEAARFVPPTDVEALTQTLAALLADRDERQRLSLAGQARAALFTWERTAELTLEVYEEALRRGVRPS